MPLQIELSGIECPDCHGTNTIKFTGEFCGVIYGCADCENNFIAESAPNKVLQPTTPAAKIGKSHRSGRGG